MNKESTQDMRALMHLNYRIISKCYSPKNTNFAAPVSMASITAGNKTPGQKKDAGIGVIVKSHAVATATRLAMPDI